MDAAVAHLSKLETHPLFQDCFETALGLTAYLITDFSTSNERRPAGISMIVDAGRFMAEQHGPEAVAEYRRVTIETITAIAAASGGFLGFGSKISNTERKVINEIENLLHPELNEAFPRHEPPA